MDEYICVCLTFITVVNDGFIEGRDPHKTKSMLPLSFRKSQCESDFITAIILTYPCHFSAQRLSNCDNQ